MYSTNFKKDWFKVCSVFFLHRLFLLFLCKYNTKKTAFLVCSDPHQRTMRQIAQIRAKNEKKSFSTIGLYTWFNSLIVTDIEMHIHITHFVSVCLTYTRNINTAIIKKKFRTLTPMIYQHYPYNTKHTVYEHFLIYSFTSVTHRTCNKHVHETFR